MREPSIPHREVEQALGYGFRDPALLEAALTHRSRFHEQGPEALLHYERLEFLGDALLGLIVSDWLYRDDPEASEGHLSRRRQSVVRTHSLAKAALELGLDRAIRLGKGEELSGGRKKPSLLADAFEAVLGAIYIDSGIRASRSFVRRALGPALEQTRQTGWAAEDYKTRLQEMIQAQLRRTPCYRIVSRTGPDHALNFEAEVHVGGDVLGRGSGTSRKLAEQAAARQALEQIQSSGETNR